MGVTQLEPGLLDHLRVQFGAHGSRAVDYLRTAERFLGSDALDVPRLGEVIAYCIREALKEIPKTSGAGPEGNWRRLSRQAVKTFEDFEASTRPSDVAAALDLAQHRAAIDELRKFHDEGEGIHQARLISLMIQRAGVEPLTSGTAPVADYQQLIVDADRVAHGTGSVEASRGLWERCVALLTQLFLPHELRHQHLVRLAAIDAPALGDLGEVLSLSGTPVHVKRFLREISNPRWLKLFRDQGALGDPGSNLWWEACSAAMRLAQTHRADVVAWLIASYDEHPESVEHARCCARAAEQIGGETLDLLLRIVRRFPQDRQIVYAGTNAAGEMDASHPLVQQFTDVLLNESTWDLVMIADGLATHLAAGVDALNAVERIEMVCHKLSWVPEDDIALGWFEYDSSGLIAEPHTESRHDRFSVLLGCLTTMLRRAWEWHPPEIVLEPVALLRPALRDRLRAWVLANSPEAIPETLAAEVEQAIIDRDATGDDVALVDRAIELSGLVNVESRWVRALGQAPSVIEMSTMLGSGDFPPREWIRASTWVAVLPHEVGVNWAAPCRVLAGKYGELTREGLLQKSTVESYDFESPYTPEELNSMPPIEAAQTIVRWRPDPKKLHINVFDLARALEESIGRDPNRWLADPLGIVIALHHPFYISHYLHGARDCPEAAALHFDGLLEVIELIRGEPWPAEDIGHRSSRISSWYTAHRAAIDLILALIRIQVRFGDMADDVWDYLSATAVDLSTPPWGSGGNARLSDIGNRAINRTSTRALEAAVLFTDQERSVGRPLRPDLEDLLDFALSLEGADGAEYRSILAPNIPWFHRVMPAWTEANLERIYGPNAPDDLGAFTFDATIQRGRADDWLLETHLDRLKEAAVRGVPNALQSVLVGMLRACAGYEPDSVATFLARHPRLVRQASGRLANLLRNDNIEAIHLDIGTEFWRALLAHATPESLTEFGWMSQVIALDDDLWAELTLATLSSTSGQTDWPDQVAERAMTAPITVDKLSIVKQIVLKQSDAWTLRRVADGAEEFFDAANDLRGIDEYEQLRTAFQERDLLN